MHDPFNKARYTQFSQNIVWHGITFLKTTTETERMFDSAASAVVDSYAAVMDNPTASNMDRFNEACDTYRAKVERGSNRAVIKDAVLRNAPLVQK